MVALRQGLLWDVLALNNSHQCGSIALIRHRHPLHTMSWLPGPGWYICTDNLVFWSFYRQLGVLVPCWDLFTDSLVFWSLSVHLPSQLGVLVPVGTSSVNLVFWSLLVHLHRQLGVLVPSCASSQTTWCSGPCQYIFPVNLVFWSLLVHLHRQLGVLVPSCASSQTTWCSGPCQYIFPVNLVFWSLLVHLHRQLGVLVPSCASSQTTWCSGPCQYIFPVNLVFWSLLVHLHRQLGVLLSAGTSSRTTWLGPLHRQLGVAGLWWTNGEFVAGWLTLLAVNLGAKVRFLDMRGWGTIFQLFQINLCVVLSHHCLSCLCVHSTH